MKNLTQLNCSLFPPLVIDLCRHLHDHGFQAYIVGGALRDALLDRPLGDIDIATDARPNDMIPLFDNIIPTGKQFGTMTVIYSNKNCRESYQVTTFRTEASYSDHRHPDTVLFSDSIEIDVSRRDFTVNALAWNPVTMAFIDIVNGQEDLRLKQLQTVGDPVDRFSEDSLRLLRLCRFHAQLGFSIEVETLTAAKKLGLTVPLPSYERIQVELSKLITAPDAWQGMRSLQQIGLLDRLLPNVVLKICPELWPVWTGDQRLAFLVQEMPDYVTCLKTLRFPKKTIAWVTRLINNANDIDRASFKVTDLEISGKQLMDRGLVGPEITTMLDRLRQLVLDGVITNTVDGIEGWLDDAIV